MAASLQTRSTARRRAPLVMAVLVLAFVAAALLALPRLRRERRTLLQLQRHIEEAAAPGEPLVLDDPWLVMAIRWVGSRAGSHREILVPKDGVPGSVFQGCEVVLVAQPQDSLVRALRAGGYTLMPEMSNTGGAAWDPDGDGVALFGHAGVRIFFVLPPAAQAPHSEVPSKP